MTLFVVILIFTGVATALWGVFNFWRRPVASGLAAVASFLLVGGAILIAHLARMKGF